MILRIGKKNRGFLLLEVMVSVAVLSVGILLILNSFVRSLRAIEFSENYFKAGLIAQEKIYEMGCAGGNRALADGVLADFGNKFSWHMDAVRIEEEAIDEIMFKVFWNERNIQHDFSVVTYFR